jgi:hypothetical protein
MISNIDEMRAKHKTMHELIQQQICVKQTKSTKQ